MSSEIRDYAKRVAEAVLDECYDEWGLEGGRRKQVDLDAIIASVPPPTAQHHDAPTCDGWWWARHSFNRRWEAVLYVYDGNQEEPEQYVVLNGQEEGRDVSEFDAWVGPLLPPDTTEPAPVATPTPDIDPEEVGRALDVLVSGGETNFTALIAAAREYLRLREQPAPDVQAQIDAAVARERKVIEARLRKTAECYPQSSDGRNTFLLEADWVRARSAKGV